MMMIPHTICPVRVEVSFGLRWWIWKNSDGIQIAAHLSDNTCDKDVLKLGPSWANEAVRINGEWFWTNSNRKTEEKT